MLKPRLLDLFCKAGGSGKGYADAGFEVVGVDKDPQPNYPFEFVEMDAVDVLECLVAGRPLANKWRAGFDVVHASPPCQRWNGYLRTGYTESAEYPDLIGPVRELLRASGLPYVIENVEGAPLIDAVRLCGTGFGLEVQRHRRFESNVPLMGMPCAHGRNAPDRFPGGRSRSRTGSSRGLVRATVEIGAWDIPLAIQQRAMGIDWMILEELSEAIPPAYTQFLGEQLMAHIQREAIAA